MYKLTQRKSITKIEQSVVLCHLVLFNSIPLSPEIPRLRCVLFTFQCKKLLLYPTGCLTLIILCGVFIKNIQTFIKYYMKNSLNIKQINQFICVGVLYTDLKISATHIFTLVNDKFWNKLVMNSEPV